MVTNYGYGGLQNGRCGHVKFYTSEIRVRGVKVWNMLPATVQKATTKVKFKLLIKIICRTN